MDVPAVSGSTTVRRMLLGARLRRLREAKGLSREEAGFVIRASDSKVSRLELGRVSFKERDVADLLILYGVTDPAEREAMLALARQANQPTWWRAYDDVTPTWFQNYLGLEEAAVEIRSYEVHFVPGLLQTPAYTRAVVSSALPRPTAEQIERTVLLRSMRQKILTRADPPQLWVVLDELALRRPIGDKKIMDGQLDYLLEVAESPRVALQILPLRSGRYASSGGAFTLLRFAEPSLADVVYLENLVSALYLDRPEQVERYSEVMSQLCVESLSPKATISYLAALRQKG
ncbi:MAG: hypothetical protein QG622_747 [Actinomycetota bacterium]|nr:hypothetical protein [Actinomycetota bacterium]